MDHCTGKRCRSQQTGHNMAEPLAYAFQLSHIGWCLKIVTSEIMKPLFLILLVLIGCSEPNDSGLTEKPSALLDLEGTWKAVSFEDYEANTVTYPNTENSFDLDIVVTFDADAKPYNFSGRNTTNDFYGNFEYLAGNRVKVSYFATTKVGQPALANEFCRAMQGEILTVFIEDLRLRLFYEDGRRSVTLIRQ